MTIAMRSGGDTGPVTIADVNLKFIWDVVSRIKIGDKGKAYVVDGNGFLVADPDIGLVLRKTDLSELPHVKAATAKQDADEPAMLSRDLAGTQVLTSMAPIESLDWKVFVEQPVAEVYAKLNASILRTGLLLLAGLVISAFGALALARGMVRPIRTLDEGARRIGAGDLDQKIEVRTGDELEGLADQFNRMTAQLRESYAGLERKVEERTHELTERSSSRRRSAEILRVISSSPPTCKPVLDAVARACAAAVATRDVVGVVLRRRGRLRFAGGLRRHGQTRNDTAMLPVAAESRNRDRARHHSSARSCTSPDIVPLLDVRLPATRGRAGGSASARCCRVPLMREGRAIGAIVRRAHGARRVHRQADRAAADLRRPGRDRDRERAPVQRDEGSARAADGDQRDPARDLELADRRAAGARRDRRARRAVCAMHRPRRCT